jgi:zinc protease
MRRTATRIASLLAFLTAPGLAQTPSAPAAGRGALEIPYTQFDLPNGLHVILHEDRTVPIVNVNLVYNVGSSRERESRTGFAHLFEHLMFMGSAHAKYGLFDSALETVGGSNNASTNSDTTNYWITVPSNALELALFLESDRMGYLLDAITPQTVDAQRDVVKNERRERVDNQPYGKADELLGELLYPKGHPYHWPVIGYMDDLTAATYDDVVAFFRKYYVPSNASLVVAGDIDPAAARKAVERWFSDVKPGPRPEPMPIPGVALTSVQKRTVTDQVQLPRLTLAWLTPRHFEPGDSALDIAASVLSGGKNSRLYKRLVYDMQAAQNVSAYQASRALSSEFYVEVTARPGRTLEELQKVIDEEIEKLKRDGPTAHEVQRAINQYEASFYSGLERLGGAHGGKADQLNAYYIRTGNADYFNEDLMRYRALSPSDIKAAAAAFLPLDRRVELTVLPAAPAK